VVGIAMVTPGGAGGYDATMVMFLAAGGIAAADATSGVLMTRVVLILGTLVSGYIVYRRAMKKYGKPDFEKHNNILE
jgi:Predicted integral membrane protein